MCTVWASRLLERARAGPVTPSNLHCTVLASMRALTPRVGRSRIYDATMLRSCTAASADAGGFDLPPPAMAASGTGAGGPSHM
jgi:hypothetical protein